MQLELQSILERGDAKGRPWLRWMDEQRDGVRRSMFVTELVTLLAPASWSTRACRENPQLRGGRVFARVGLGIE